MLIVFIIGAGSLLRGYKPASETFAFLQSASSREAFARQTKAPLCFLSPVFKKAAILVCRENNKLKKKMVNAACCPHLQSKSGLVGLNTPPPLSFSSSQTNARSALSHGDSDPVRFRWLIPFSALQVRLGNTAGEKLRYPLRTSAQSFCPSVSFIHAAIFLSTCGSVF